MQLFGIKTKIKFLNHPTHSIFPIRIRYSKEDSDILFKYKYNHNYKYDDKDSLEYYDEYNCYGPNKVFLLAAYLHHGYEIKITDETDYRVMIQSFSIIDDKTGNIAHEYINNIYTPSNPCMLIAFFMLKSMKY